jgi:hypothetical protein
MCLLTSKRQLGAPAEPKPASDTIVVKTQPIVLRPKRSQFLVLATICLAFVLIGAWGIARGEQAGWFCCGFFGLGIPVALISMLPNASSLELNSEGFTVRSLFRSGTTRWEDVSDFGVGRIGPNAMVMFNFVDTYRRAGPIRWVNAALTGYEAALPDSYGLRADELADVMNGYRAPRAWSGTPQSL